MVFSGKYFNKVYWFLCVLVFLFISLRAFIIPFTHDEAATFFFYIQSGNFLPYKAHVYTNNHFLNSAVCNLLYSSFGSHRFVLRLPNLFSFMVLCFAVFKIFRHLKSLGAKLMLFCFFILTIRFLDFFELCRGYGISIGCMVLGLAYLLDYFNEKKFKDLVLFSFFWQLALAANLILVVAFAILLISVFIFQWQEKILFTFKNIIWIGIQLLPLVFWVRFSFFYKEQGVLDSGIGENYWVVTFKSLIDWLFGADQIWLYFTISGSYLTLLVFAIQSFRKRALKRMALFSPQIFFILLFSCLVLIFYLQKRILGINFPEDRTGIFFYIFFILGLVFSVEQLSLLYSKIIAYLSFGFSLFSFLLAMNFSNFYSSFYQTMPKALFDSLLWEYNKTGQIFTIGGHRVRELNYAFMNYRGGAILNPMDDSEQMRMNCDYYFALKREKPYYRFFYNEIGFDEKWDRVLLKRKEPLIRKEITKVFDLPAKYKGDREFFEFIRLNDTIFRSKNCIEAEIEILFKKVPKPFRAFLVFSMDNIRGETVYYKRVPLNWLADDLNGETKFLKLTSGQPPSNFRNLVVYLWNIDQADIEFDLKATRILELHGKGVNFSVPEKFYPLVEKITKQSLL